MVVPAETIWPIEPHTEAKHKIVRRYLDAWFAILSRYHGRIVYVDGFAGPGRYTGGQPGSPVIALDRAKNHSAPLQTELVFLFIEREKHRCEHLKYEVEKLQCPDKFKIEIKCGDFAPELTKELDALAQQNKSIAPTFALIDPFGFSGIPYYLIQRLLSNDRCEVFVSLMVDSINRWLELESVREHILEAFGTDEAFAIATGGGDRVQALKSLYHTQLRKIAKFVRYFELRDDHDRVVYYLFFASNNATGHYKMKEAMWKVDPLGDFSFSDATNPNQAILFQHPSLGSLTSDLIQKFLPVGKTPIGQVETYVADETGFLSKHMREVLSQLESEGRVEIAPLKTNGEKRRRNTYPNDAQITFL